jgi:hypothetical protein
MKVPANQPATAPMISHARIPWSAIIRPLRADRAKIERKVRPKHG